jgi:hypothetical protein
MRDYTSARLARNQRLLRMQTAAAAIAFQTCGAEMCFGLTTCGVSFCAAKKVSAYGPRVNAIRTPSKSLPKKG